MDSTTQKKVLISQFTATIDTLENAINKCPDNLWEGGSDFHQFWYMASHTLFWLDYYLSDSFENFQPPEPFGLEEMDPAGVIPDPAYTKEQLLKYLVHGRNKCIEVITNMTEADEMKEYKFGKASLSRVELHLYILRHVQHHAAQLNLLLRQKADIGSSWVFKGKE